MTHPGGDRVSGGQPARKRPEERGGLQILYTTEEAARALHISRTYLLQLVSRGEIRPRWHGRSRQRARGNLYDLTELYRFIDAHFPFKRVER